MSGRFNFKILKEQVSDKDQLKSGSHQFVAESMYRVMKDNDGCTIGLEGGLGTGKSTVIGLLEKKFEDEALFYTFDAKSHDDDSIRKIFLQEFIETVIKKKSGNDGLASKEHDQLYKDVVNDIKISSTTKSIKLNSYQVLMAASLLLVPFSLAVIRSYDVKKVCMAWEPLCEIDLMLSAALAFLGLPFLVFVSWALSVFFRNESKPINIFANDGGGSNEVVLSRGDKDSLEFESLFNRIVERAAVDINRVVIVVDNLDRLEKDRFEKIWSMLQMFFHSNLNKELWFLVPYDRKCLENFNEGEVDDRFFNKHFQCIFNVPYSESNTWQNFLSEKLKESLPELEIKEIDMIRSECSLMLDSYEVSVTPRFIVSLVNQIGLAASMYQDVYSYESIVAYACLKKSKDDEALKKYIVSDKKQGALIDNTYANEVASMMYGVKDGCGVQILLEELLVQGFDNCATYDLKRYYELYDKSFKDAFLRISSVFLKKTKNELVEDNRILAFEVLNNAGIVALEWDNSFYFDYYDHCLSVIREKLYSDLFSYISAFLRVYSDSGRDLKGEYDGVGHTLMSSISVIFSDEFDKVVDAEFTYVSNFDGLEAILNTFGMIIKVVSNYDSNAGIYLSEDSFKIYLKSICWKQKPRDWIILPDINMNKYSLEFLERKSKEELRRDLMFLASLSFFVSDNRNNSDFMGCYSAIVNRAIDSIGNGDDIRNDTLIIIVINCYLSRIFDHSLEDKVVWGLDNRANTLGVMGIKSSPLEFIMYILHLYANIDEDRFSFYEFEILDDDVLHEIARNLIYLNMLEVFVKVNKRFNIDALKSVERKINFQLHP